MLTGPYSEYVNMVYLTIRDIAEWEERGRPESVRDMSGKIKGAEKIRKELIASGEDPDERVIIVGLGKPLEKGMEMPKIYRGFKVFVLGVIGEIRPC